MFFDWYQASVPEDPATLLAVLQRDLRSVHEMSRPRYGYAVGVELRSAGSVVGEVFYGGSNGSPHVQATGSAAPALVAVLRETWPAHKVSRLDVAEDFDEGPETFDRLWRMALEVAREHSVTVGQAGDWVLDGRAGRTFYVGSWKSPVMLRIYEKGKQLRAIGAPGAEDVSLDLVRVELVVRPTSRAKAQAARLTPEGAFGCAVWSQDFADRLWAMDVPRVHLHVSRDSDDERAMHYAAKQYAGAFGRLIAAGATEAEVFEAFRARVMTELARKVA